MQTYLIVKNFEKKLGYSTNPTSYGKY